LASAFMLHDICGNMQADMFPEIQMALEQKGTIRVEANGTARHKNGMTPHGAARPLSTTSC